METGLWHEGGQTSEDSDDLDPDLQILEEEKYHFHRLDGVILTGSNYPVCLDHESFGCDDCDFFDEEDCRLRRSRALREEIWAIVKPWAIYQTRRLELERVLQIELQSHGRPLHWTIIAQIIEARYPQLDASRAMIRRVLGTSKHFEEAAPGVYQLASTTSETLIRL